MTSEEADLRPGLRAAKLEKKYQAGKLQKHCKRASVFADWLLQTFSLDQHARVLDVAGGSGELSFDLVPTDLTCLRLCERVSTRQLLIRGKSSSPRSKTKP